MKEPVVTDSIDLTSKMDQGNLGSIYQNEVLGNVLLGIENAYCIIEKGKVKDFRKPRSEEISGEL
jgi:hypothetical protein